MTTVLVGASVVALMVFILMAEASSPKAGDLPPWGSDEELFITPGKTVDRDGSPDP
jgi:hypothetical protein